MIFYIIFNTKLFVMLHKKSIDKIYLTLYNGSTGSVVPILPVREKEYMRAGALYLDSLDSLPWTALVLIVLNRLDGRNGLTARMERSGMSH